MKYYISLGLILTNDPIQPYSDELGMPEQVKVEGFPERPSAVLQFRTSQGGGERRASELHLIEFSEEISNKEIDGVGPHMCVYAPTTKTFRESVEGLFESGVVNGLSDMHLSYNRMFGKDPDGYTVEMQVTPPSTLPKGVKPAGMTPHHVAINYMRSEEGLRAIQRFYQGVMGLPVLKGVDWSNRYSVWGVQLTGSEIHFVGRGAGSAWPLPQQHVCFEYESRDEFEGVVERARRGEFVVWEGEECAFLRDHLGYGVVVFLRGVPER